MMSNQDQIERLQGLLDRVQKNAARPRVAAAVAAAPLPEPAPEPTEEEELVAMDEAEVIPPEPVLAEAEVLEETSMVRAIAESEVSVEMGEASIEDLDLLEDEIVDITEAAPEPAASEAEEEPPASSRRAIAGSMGEALAEAVDTAGMDEGREIPLKTPPPESGPRPRRRRKGWPRRPCPTCASCTRSTSSRAPSPRRRSWARPWSSSPPRRVSSSWANRWPKRPRCTWCVKRPPWRWQRSPRSNPSSPQPASNRRWCGARPRPLLRRARSSPPPRAFTRRASSSCSTRHSLSVATDRSPRNAVSASSQRTG